MGYYASTSWDVTFRNEAAKEAARQELADQLKWTFNVHDNWLENVGEWADEEWDGLSLVGTTNGKYYGDGALDIIAKYATGTVDFDGSDSGDGYYRHLLGDGKVKVLVGQIVYLDLEGE